MLTITAISVPRGKKKRAAPNLRRSTLFLSDSQETPMLLLMACR